MVTQPPTRLAERIWSIGFFRTYAWRILTLRWFDIAMENHHFKFQEVSQFSVLSLAILNYRRVDDRHLRRKPKPCGLVQKAPRTQGKPQLRISQGPSEEGHLDCYAVEEIHFWPKKWTGKSVRTGYIEGWKLWLPQWHMKNHWQSTSLGLLKVCLFTIRNIIYMESLINQIQRNSPLRGMDRYGGWDWML